MKIGSFSVHWKSIAGVALALLGWIVSSGPAIIPILPPEWQKDAGDAVTIAGFVLTFFAPAPHKEP